MTASTLYEAVEPHLLWKRLYSIIYAEVTSQDVKCEVRSMSVPICISLVECLLQGCDMIMYILSTFHSQDEEIEIVHLPVVFAAVGELLAVSLTHECCVTGIETRWQTCTREQPPRIAWTALRKVLALQKEILRHMSPASPLKSRPAVSRELESTSAASGPTIFACLFYGIPSTLAIASRASPALPNNRTSTGHHRGTGEPFISYLGLESRLFTQP